MRVAIWRPTHIGSIPMMSWLGSASRLAKYPPPRKRPAKVVGTLVSVDQSLLCRRRERYWGHESGRGPVDWLGPGDAEEEEGEAEGDEVDVDANRTTKAADEGSTTGWDRASGRSAARAIGRDMADADADASASASARVKRE